ncbi:hypothetical protein MA785_000812 [Vibrio parahaemolyticus]|nr:hypothetical protein [Vibrio parahaemolyticus]EJR2787921.1 hypothetical protein [Vibrio parahaemolyticus]
MKNSKRNKEGLLAKCSNSFAFLYSKLMIGLKSFIKQFSIPKTYKELKNRNIRNRIAGSKKQFFLIAILFIAMFSFNLAHSFAAQGIINAENYIVLSTFYDVFPSVKPMHVESNSAVSGLASDTLGLLTAVIMEITIFLLSILIPFMFIKVVLIFKVDNQVSGGEVSRLLLFVLLLSSMGLYSIEHETKNGLTFKTTMMHHFALSYFGNTLEKLEKNGSKNYDEQYLVPEIKLGNEKSQTMIFSEFTNAYLSQDFKEGEEFKFNIQQVESQSDTGYVYTVNINLGSQNLKYTIAPNSYLTKAGSKNLDIDFVKLEEKLIVDLFQSMVDHAVKVKKRTSEFKFIDPNGLFSQFDDVPSYESDFSKYCDTIYNPVPEYTEKRTFNKYLTVAAACASKEFVSKNYENKFYTYGSSKLRDGYTMLFGDSVTNEKMKLSEIMDSTKSICQDGYFACAEAMQYANRLYTLNEKDVGLLTPVIREVDQFTQSFEDYSDDLITSLSVNKSLALTSDFSDESDWGSPLKTIQGEAVGGDYSLYIASDLVLLLDFADMNFPDADGLTSIFAGRDWKEPFERMKTCFAYSSMVKNGFRCKNATEEVNDLSISLLRMGIDVYLMTKVASVPLESSVKKSKNKNQKKGNTEFEVGKGSFIKDNFGEVATIGAALGGMAVSENMFKDTPYYSSETVLGLIATNTFFNMFGQRDINPLNNVAMWMIKGGITLFIFGHSLLWLLMIMFFRKFVEVIVEVVCLTLIFTISIINGGFKAAFERIREFYFDNVILVIICLLLTVYEHFRDVVIRVQARSMVENMNNVIVDSGWSNLLANIGILVFMTAITAVITYKALNNALNGSTGTIESNIKGGKR